MQTQPTEALKLRSTLEKIIESASRLNDKESAMSAECRYELAGEIERNTRQLLFTVGDTLEPGERFLRRLSHDLRAPLTAARLHAQLMVRKNRDSDSVKDISMRVISNIDRADSMLSDLIDDNKLKSGLSLPILIDACKLDRVVENAVRSLQSVLSASSFEISNEAKGLTGFWDARRLQRLLELLVCHAAMNAPAGSLTAVRIEIRGATLVVSGQGPADRTRELKLAEGIVKAHLGSMRLEQTSAGENALTVELPLDCRIQSSANSQ